MSMSSGIVQELLNVTFWLWFFLLAIIFAVHLDAYFIDSHRIRRNGISGPFLARFSGAWLGWVVFQGRQSEVVHSLHKKFGTFVRLSPNHVSISDPDALRLVYGRGNGALKSDYYDAFLAVRPSIFTTRSKEEHARKRTAIAHAFSQKSVLEFEPYIRLHVAELFNQWDRMCNRGKNGLSGTEGEGGWIGQGGRVWFDIMPWFHYLAFDVMSDLAFGASFGMVRNAKDAAPIAVDQRAAMAQYQGTRVDSLDLEKPSIDVKEVPAVTMLNAHIKVSARMAAVPPRWRPILQRLPCFARDMRASEDLVALAVAAVARRLVFPAERIDVLSKLQETEDEHGRVSNMEDLTTDAFTQLVAGSDTVSSTACGIAHCVAANSRVRAKLQQELDVVFGGSYDPVATYAQIKRLPYLEAVIIEGLRVHSTSGLGLPRTVPNGGLIVCGKWFSEGTVLSVPTYTIHRDPIVWGEDADAFRPDRWFERDQTILQKAFSPFSFGPRACIGRELAIMELCIFVSSIFHRYDLELEAPDKPLTIREDFIRKPVACRVGMKRRNI
ncbi:cytochrome P450 monooxygenase pc-bph [Fomitiporia mediterranea MF3/22]|uniref:Cytochrome P450 monooxygenase pc-bph n=1 Tax=Fomitiporia mediterranea (strain MF3/22) TaxID=694068 RepID=R7SJ73_FOMME|nr:cytochrome P450 monooxygenase pc-bph [Fomitiporia mediterranea MF3/22]EJC97664.1 cytochrome P450 monooxygenase pc-bph [Fomitiporia mediterranea MF3/22]